MVKGTNTNLHQHKMELTTVTQAQDLYDSVLPDQSMYKNKKAYE